MLDRRAWAHFVRLLTAISVAFVIALGSRTASAYPWMIRHEYQGCVPCHADPSGAGLLTEYGRAMGENVLRTRYGSPSTDEPPVYARFAFGVPMPDWLLLGGSFRDGVQFQDPAAGQPFAAPLFLEMETDLKALVTASRFRAYASVGWMRQGAQLTQITSHVDPADCGLAGPGPVCAGNLVSREHWVGVDLGDDKQFLLRAGRIDVPFGIRMDEHDLFVRSTETTRTNINESQQHGVALSYTGQSVRGEIMLVLGNYQMNPDAFRERGYAGFIEFSVKPWAAVGASSLVTYARTDFEYQTQHTVRQVHGAFARLVPVRPLVILSEMDALVTTSDAQSNGTGGTVPGFIAMAQADIEPTQGLHIVLTGEVMAQGGAGGPYMSYDSWNGVLWFFAPHADARFDFVAVSTANQAVGFYLLPQLHVYL
jgi:hypothetical protein